MKKGPTPGEGWATLYHFVLPYNFHRRVGSCELDTGKSDIQTPAHSIKMAQPLLSWAPEVLLRGSQFPW